MKRKLVGGEFLLDLTPITIAESEDGETYTNITNASVIEQLTNLKTFISNPNAIKPIWVKFVNDEDNAVIVTRGSLSIVDTGEFDIDVAIKGYTLKIHIEFTQAELEDHTPIDDWYIDTNDAKYLFTSEAQNISPIVEDVAEEVAKDVIESPESGTIADVLGLDSEGKLVKGSVGGGTKLYKHYLTLKFPNKTIGDTTVNTLVTTLITNSSNVISASNLASELSKIVCIQGISQFKSGSYPIYDIDLLKIEDSGGIQIKYFPLQAIGTLASMTYQTGISLGSISGFTEITDSVTAL